MLRTPFIPQPSYPPPLIVWQLSEVVADVAAARNPARPQAPLQRNKLRRLARVEAAPLGPLMQLLRRQRRQEAAREAPPTA